MKIGNIKLESRLILAPMAGVNCAAFRLICRESGAGMVSTPMLKTEEIVNNHENLIKRVCFLKEEKPISVQLVGNNGQSFEEATRIINDYADVIDLNLGCPEKEILGLKAGGFFSKHPEQIKKILVPIMNNTNKPVTAKIRIGWDEKSINVLDSVRILQDLGVNAITIHARSVKQGYSGKADWEKIREAKEKSNIPIIGNGDIFLAGNAKAMIEKTKCDLVMIGRGAMGNPLIFKRTNELLEKGKNSSEISFEEQKQVFKKFMHYYEKYENNRSITELKQQAMWFTKGMSGAKDARQNLMKAKTPEELFDKIKKTF